MAKLPDNISVTVQAKGSVIKIPSQKQLEEQFRPYAAELGRLVFAWNRLHETLAALFWAITGFKRSSMAHAIWYATDSERTQRQMLRRLAAVVFSNDSEKRNGVTWLLNEIDSSLAGNRNDAIHTPLAFFTDSFGVELRPDSFSGSPRAKGLAGKDLMIEFNWYRERADVFSAYAEKMRAVLINPKLQSWPETPALPQKAQTKSRKATPHQKPGK